MGKNKAKTAASVAVVAKSEVKIWWRPKNQFFDLCFLFTPSDSFSLGRTVLPQYKMSQMIDRQTTQCTKGSTDSTVGQCGGISAGRDENGKMDVWREATR